MTVYPGRLRDWTDEQLNEAWECICATYMRSRIADEEEPLLNRIMCIQITKEKQRRELQGSP